MYYAAMKFTAPKDNQLCFSLSNTIELRSTRTSALLVVHVVVAPFNFHIMQDVNIFFAAAAAVKLSAAAVECTFISGIYNFPHSF